MSRCNFNINMWYNFYPYEETTNFRERSEKESSKVFGLIHWIFSNESETLEKNSNKFQETFVGESFLLDEIFATCK